MKILTDYHHHALAESLQLTLGDRLGAEVYFPQGIEWFDQGYWSFEKHVHGDAVAKQYLVGIWAGAEYSDRHAIRHDHRHPGRDLKGVTLEQARSTEWDIVLSSLPHNYDGYHRFAQEVGARYAIQLGNDVQPFDIRASFALSSSTLPSHGPEYIGRRFEVNGVPTVMYHQEFSLETFRFEYPPSGRYIASFVNCFPEGPSYPEFLAFARSHPEFDWRVYGALGTGIPDEFNGAGDLSTTPIVADAMRAARVIWHSKHWSDGFGHVIHNAFAVGRPVVGYQGYYANKLASPLWIDGVTSFDLATRTQDELATLLHRLVNDDDYHQQISENAASRFREIVDFDAEAELIGELTGMKVPVVA